MNNNIEIECNNVSAENKGFSSWGMKATMDWQNTLTDAHLEKTASATPYTYAYGCTKAGLCKEK